MKIVKIITRLDKGGSAEVVINLAEAIFKNNFDVVLIYGGMSRFIFPFRCYFIDSLCREINLFKDFISFLKIFWIIIKEKPDIIHTHTSKAGFIGRWAGFLYKIFFNRNVKIIHTPHGHVFYGYFGKLKTNFFIILERITLWITDRLVAISENEKIESINYGVGSSDKWVVIPAGIDYNFEIKDRDLRRKLNVDENKIIVGSVMRLEDIKGDIYFVLAAAEVLKKCDSIFFILVGDGKNKRMLESRVKELGIDKNFFFAGWQSEVYDWINIMDIYVQPSLNEGLGRAVIMAELLAKPIIASSVCGLKDLVKDGVNGFLVKPGDVSGFAYSIIKIAGSIELCHKMGYASYMMVNEIIDGFKKYSIERSIYLHTRLYYS